MGNASRKSDKTSDRWTDQWHAVSGPELQASNQTADEQNKRADREHRQIAFLYV